MLNGIAVSVTETEAPARLMVMTVFSLTFVVSAGETVSSGSKVMSPASSTDFTSVKSVPGTTRVLPLIFTVTYEVLPFSASRALPREASLASETEYAETDWGFSLLASAVAYRLWDTKPPVANSPTAATVAAIFTSWDLLGRDKVAGWACLLWLAILLLHRLQFLGEFKRFSNACARPHGLRRKTRNYT